MGAVLVRVAAATHASLEAVVRAPYARTLWTYRHLEQMDRLEEYRVRGHALYEAGLMTLAFNDPKKLEGEHRRLLDDVGLVPSATVARERAAGIIAAVAALDRAEGRL